MYLKSLELSGFKSFAKKTTLSFNQSITAIVGPNGSGKSNLAEAFRFALGEQSMKSLRGKRGEDLIFSGTTSAPRSNRAEAHLVFDNSTRLFDIDFPDVVIERTVFRDGVNEYAINNSKVRLKDVHSLLAHANIGASSHHIISQGEADRILSAHPKERRVMIEEALGLRVFKYKKDEAEKKLAKTNENKAHVESLRKEIAPHLRFLKKQIEKIEYVEKTKKELIDAYVTYFAKEAAYIQEQEKKLINTEPLVREQEELAKEKEQLIATARADTQSDVQRELQKEIAEMEKVIKDLEQEETALALERGRAEGVLSAEQKNNTTEEIIQIPKESFEEFKEHVGEMSAVGEDADTFSNLRQSFDALVSGVREFINTYMVPTRSNSVDTDELIAEVAELQEKHEQIQKKIEHARSAITDLQKQLVNEETQHHVSEKRLLEIQARSTEIRAELAEAQSLKTRVQILKAVFEEDHREALGLLGKEAVTYEVGEYAEEERSLQENLKKNIERMKIRIEELGGGGDEVIKEHKEITERDAFLKSEIDDLEKTIESLQELIAELDTELTNTFNEGLVSINKAFNEFFVTMFGGGSARLVAVRASEEEEDKDIGIDVAVSVPGKRVKGLMALSGGERALASIALIFAMSQVNPPPFLILDETDAALDEANSRRYGDMIENLSKRTQLILITHNRETMSRAGVLYGVTMGGDGISKLLSIKFDEAVKVAK